MPFSRVHSGITAENKVIITVLTSLMLVIIKVSVGENEVEGAGMRVMGAGTRDRAENGGLGVAGQDTCRDRFRQSSEPLS